MNGVKRTIIIIFIILILLIYAVLTQNPILIAVNLSIISFLFGKNNRILLDPIKYKSNFIKEFIIL